MKSLGSCIFLVFVVILVGCAGQSGAVRSAPKTPTLPALPTSITAPVSTPIEVNQTPLTQTQAWGNGHVSKFPITFGDRYFNPGGSYGENTITDDGQMCGNIESAIPFTDPAQLLREVQSIALINLHTGVMTTIQTLSAGYQGLSCAVTGAWVIWLQAYGATYESFQRNWRIMALNRQTHELRLLDQSTLPNGQPAPAKILPYPSASNGTVVWTSFADNQANTEAVRYDLATQQKTVLAQRASNPQIWWPWVSWGDASKQGIVFENLATQQQVFLNQRPTGSALNGTSFAIADTNYTTITLYPSITPDQIGTSYIIGRGINGDFVQFPYLNDRLVTWDSNQTLFAFDRKLQRLVQIDGITGNPQPYISSHYFVWEQDSMYVIDTNTLP